MHGRVRLDEEIVRKSTAERVYIYMYIYTPAQTQLQWAATKVCERRAALRALSERKKNYLPPPPWLRLSPPSAQFGDVGDTGERAELVITMEKLVRA